MASMASTQAADNSSNDSGLLVVMPTQPLICRDMDDDEFAALVENRRQIALHNIAVAEANARISKEKEREAKEAKK